MALVRPVHVGVENIMTAFDNLSKTGDQVFAVWYGANDIAFQCCIDDPTVQREMLENNLEAMAKSGNTDLLHLKMYPAGQYGFIDSKSKPVSNTPIQVCEYQLPPGRAAVGGESAELPSIRPPGMSREAWDLLHRLETMPDTIGAKIDEAVNAKLTEMFGEEDQEPEVDQMERTMGVINGLTQNPVIMGIIGKLFEMFTNRPAVMPAPYPTPTIGMAETTAPPAQPQQIPFDEAAMNEALSTLSFHCDLGVCLQKLAAIAQNNPAYFKVLINMLMSS